MSLTERINLQLKEAMKAKNASRLRSLRAIKAELLLLKTRETQAEISEEDEKSALVKMAKQRRESLKVYREKGREDLALIEEEELLVIEEFLPKQLSPEALKEQLRLIIHESGATGLPDMGKVMGLASARLKGQAEGATIANAVRELLNS